MAISNEQQLNWRPGRAGACERVLIGSGGDQTTDRNHWLLYALGTKLIVEFYDGTVLVASRMLECSGLLTEVGDTAIHVIALGYDFTAGRISLGVTAKDGAQSHIVFKGWNVPELVGFGFDVDNIYVGGMELSNLAGTSQWRTAWGYIKPIQGQFASEQPLTQGYLAELMGEV